VKPEKSRLTSGAERLSENQLARDAVLADSRGPKQP
jgi:hypothetical protein